MGRKVDTRMNLRSGRSTRSDQERNALEMGETTFRTSLRRKIAGHAAREARNGLIGGFLGTRIAPTQPNAEPNETHLGNLGLVDFLATDS